MVVREFVAQRGCETSLPVCSSKLTAGTGCLQAIEIQRDDEVSTATRRHSSPAPILDEFPPRHFLKTFEVKGRKPYHAERSLQP